VGHDVEDCADNKGWDSMALDDMGDETDGLVAEGSVGGQQCQIYPCFRESTAIAGASSCSTAWWERTPPMNET
jgi:hypothetical protein